MSRTLKPVIIKKSQRSGRLSGSRNSSAQSARLAIAIAFHELGGAEALIDWARESDENLRVFYTKIFPKLITSRYIEDDGSLMANAIAVRFV